MTDESTARSEKELQQRVLEFAQVWAKSDVVTLGRLLASDYLHTDFEGKVQNRDEWLAYAQSPRPVKRVEFEDVKIRLYGDVAVITGKNAITVSGKNVITGEKIEGESKGTIRFTQVWVKEDGTWKRALFQATPIKDR